MLNRELLSVTGRHFKREGERALISCTHLRDIFRTCCKSRDLLKVWVKKIKLFFSQFAVLEWITIAREFTSCDGAMEPLLNDFVNSLLSWFTKDEGSIHY